MDMQFDFQINELILKCVTKHQELWSLSKCLPTL